MTKWLSLLLLTVACSAPHVDEAPPDVILSAVSEPSLELKTHTICATAEALEIEPRLNDLVREALTYWDDAGMDVSAWSVPEGEDCEIDVAFPAVDCDYWVKHPKAAAAAQVKGKMRPGECTPQALFVSLAQWGRMIDNGWEQTAITHEFGHLLCLPHVLDDDADIMSPAGGVE